MSIHILYLHGFNSSPESMKAKVTCQYFSENFPYVRFHCPQIASNPKDAILQLEQLINHYSVCADNAQWYFIGSSLGGYFSTYFSEKYQRPSVLINPAVKPYQLLSDYLGEQVNPYTNEVYQVTVDFIDELKKLEQAKLEKNNYLLMVQTGDEVLDYRQAVKFYQNAQIIEQQGGDHSFVDYEKMLPNIVKFFHLTEPNLV
ncbi:MAG: esterase YqiA [Colwellia sp.]|nr:esterase YqiA [Colwellia sp.]